MIGAGVCILLAPYLQPVARSVNQTTTSDLWIATIAALLIAIPAIWHAGHGRWRAFFGIRHFRSHPPIWVAVLIGTWIILLIQLGFGKTLAPVDNRTLRQCLWYGVPCFLLGPVTVSFLLSLALRLKPSSPTKSDSTSSPRSHEPLSESSDLIAWFSADTEIERPEDDRFQHNEIAQRIAQRIAEPGSTGEAPTIALVGPLGSGKSTIARLVEHHTSGNQSIEIVRVSLWPFESPEAAVRGILAALIKGLAPHVNSWNLSGIPEQYASTVERVGGRWAAFAGLLTVPHRPEDVLNRLEAITLAINVRMILWIEDLERFANIGDKSDQESRTADTRLGPIRALLSLLDRRKRISVVVADCSLDARFDLHKIARFIEHIPALDPEIVRRVFAVYWKRCFHTQEMESIIDSVPSQTRKEFLKDVGEWVREYVRDFTGNLHIESALSILLSTPRSLKSALRAAHEVWDQLKGEIDLDDVLLMSAIRVARPSVFAFVDRNINAFRSGFRRLGVDEKDPKEHPTYVEFESLLNNEKNNREREAIRKLLAEVFPEIPESGYQMDRDQWSLARPQGLAVKGHTDYWRRYLSLPDISEAESDQAAMRSIKRWQDQKQSDLIARLTDPEKHSQIEHFLCLFDSKELLRLLREVARIASTEAARDWVDRITAPGVVPVWRMMIRRTPPSASIRAALLDLIESIDPPHLPLLHTLEYYIATPGADRLSPLMEQDDRDKVRSAVQDALLKCSAGGPKELLASLRDGSPYTLIRLTWGELRLGLNQTTGQPFEGWQRFAKVMLEAAELNPIIGLAQIVPFVTIEQDKINRDAGGHPTRLRVAQFNRERAEQLFEFNHLMRIFAENDIPNEIPDDLKKRWVAAKQACQDQSPPSKPSPDKQTTFPESGRVA